MNSYELIIPPGIYVAKEFSSCELRLKCARVQMLAISINLSIVRWRYCQIAQNG